MFISPKNGRLVLALSLTLISIAEFASSRRLSFKESLTAYAESEEPPQQYNYNYSQSSHKSEKGIRGNENLTKEGLITSTERRVNDDNFSTGTNQQYSASAISWDSSTNGIIAPTLEPTARKPVSLWEITKSMLHLFQQKGSKRFIAGPSTDDALASESNVQTDLDLNGAKGTYNLGGSRDGTLLPLSQTKEIAKQQPRDNFLTTVKNDPGGKMGNLSYDNKNNATRNTLNMTIPAYLKDLEEQQQRTKKDVSSNAGLQDLLWNTAIALWSVNKEHFLPTFLHTKTGGKLSLIRDSIFKPITILSQFRSGVQQINNEKWRNLARLTTGSGWGSPNSQVVLVKLQPQNSQLLTLAKYMLRLTKHTVITKYKLKRALLDLQFRALKKLIRILSSKNIGQKIATIKILTNAVWKGKLAFLRILTGGNKANSTVGPYAGKDNSINVDLTYSSLGNNYKDGGWISNSYSYSPPPPLPPAPHPHAHEEDSYLTPPPVPALHTNYYHNPEHTPRLPLFPPAPSPSYAYRAPEPLIEAPSYASVLKIMGINPSNNKYEDPRTTTKAPSSEYYSPTEYYDSPSPIYKSPLIEKPAASYSYHFSGPSSPRNNDLFLSPSSPFKTYIPIKPLKDKPVLTTYNRPFFQNVQSSKEDKAVVVTTTPSSFRLKLLEAMSPPADEDDDAVSS